MPDFFPSFGNLPLNVVAFIVAISIIVFVHEFGHYIIGRWSGIHAEVFSLGFGKALWSRVDRRGTRWQVAAIPLGGYVKFLGDANAASGRPDGEVLGHLSADERRHTLHGAPLWARAATVAAGPMFNFVLSFVIFSAVALQTGVQTAVPTIAKVYPLPFAHEVAAGDEILGIAGVATPDYETLQTAYAALPAQPMTEYRIRRDGVELSVSGPALQPARALGIRPGSPADAAGMLAGDVITAVDGAPIYRLVDLQDAVRKADGKPIDLTVWRAGETTEIRLTARRDTVAKPGGGFEDRWLIGIESHLFFEPALQSVGPLKAASLGAEHLQLVITQSLSSLWHVVTGAISSCNIRGAITIAKVSGEAAAAGLTEFIWFVGFMSAAIGLINLFPVPVLDGGHLVFHAWEWASGKPPGEKFLRVVLAIGLVLILSLMLFGLTNDVVCP